MDLSALPTAIIQGETHTTPPAPGVGRLLLSAHPLTHLRGAELGRGEAGSVWEGVRLSNRNADPSIWEAFVNISSTPGPSGKGV